MVAGLKLAAAVAAVFFLASHAQAQLIDALTGPKTLVDRAIEARSSEDIKKDNEIVLEVNEIMADLETLKASTTIYEQRLLITGLFDDEELYDKFKQAVEKVEGVKKLYWHAVYISAEEQETRDDLLSWDEVLVMNSKAEGRLIGTAGVADVNFRVETDVFAKVYLLGRARSEGELEKALARTKDGEGVREVVNYAAVRP